MKIKSAEFIKSSARWQDCPKPNFPEYGFIGRSNVGKSSLINALVNRKGLAKTSGKPGKTQLINHFLINDAWYLVDLPGYGFAKVPKKERAKWDKMIKQYILNRENLLNLFLLVDVRLPMQTTDKDFLYWLGENQIPFSVTFTKSDKLNKGKLASNVGSYKKELMKFWEELPPVFVTSAKTGAGKEEVLGYVEEVNGVFR